MFYSEIDVMSRAPTEIENLIVELSTMREKVKTLVTPVDPCFSMESFRAEVESLVEVKLSSLHKC